jgi:transcriptional regulator with XRE-family HTH domain
MARTALGEHLAKLRKEKGLSQADLAKATGGAVQVLTVSRIEQGLVLDPSWSTMCALADGLGVKLDKLRPPEE